MGLPKIKQEIFTVDEYLAIERSSDERHEYLDGFIYAMAGESWHHGTITINIVVSLANQLKGKPCAVRDKDTKVRSGPTPKLPRSRSGLYSYPDVVVVCDDPEFQDKHQDIVLNPTVIIEVLSPTTEEFDRGEKLSRYQTWNRSLKDCLLVSQDQPHIEHYSRQEGGGWSCQRHTGVDSSFAIASIQCTLHLADVYDRIAFATS
jgi:Uma2 family endonuclease